MEDKSTKGLLRIWHELRKRDQAEASAFLVAHRDDKVFMQLVELHLNLVSAMTRALQDHQSTIDAALEEPDERIRGAMLDSAMETVMDDVKTDLDLH